MSERKPINVRITHGRNKRGAFVLNGEDISDRVSGVNVEIVANQIAFVTVKLRVDDLDLDVEGDSDSEVAQA